MSDKTAIIRDRNDAFRSRDPMDAVPGRYVVTPGITDLLDRHAGYEMNDVFTEVALFKDFDEDNDPHGEHDFGVFDFLGERLFWKIDYYDTQYRYGSPDPSDILKTCRVLTVMLAHEY